MSSLSCEYATLTEMAGAVTMEVVSAHRLAIVSMAEVVVLVVMEAEGRVDTAVDGAEAEAGGARTTQTAI